MICRNCSFILQGSEKFCPNCGFDCAQKPQTEKSEEILPPEPPSILFSANKEQPAPQAEDHRIFREAPEETIEEKVTPKKSRAPAVLVFLLIAVILSVGGITVIEYFELGPIIANYLQTGGTAKDTQVTTETAEKTTEGEYSQNYGVVSPDINFRPTICYVASDKSVCIRKGPDDSYAPIDLLESGIQLQVIGASNINDTWVYVYVPFVDCYGWLSASFLSDASVLTEEETTDEETTENETENSAPETA